MRNYVLDSPQMYYIMAEATHTGPYRPNPNRRSGVRIMALWVWKSRQFVTLIYWKPKLLWLLEKNSQQWKMTIFFWLEFFNSHHQFSPCRTQKIATHFYYVKDADNKW